MRNASAGRRSPVIDLGNMRAMKGQGGAATALQMPPEPQLDSPPPARPQQQAPFAMRREIRQGRSPDESLAGAAA